MTEFRTKGLMEQQGVDDLVLLPQVTEDGICGNLLKRFRSDLIYTNIGPVLISVNPFRWIKGICDDENVDQFRGRFRHEVQPNIFALAEEAYRSVKNEQENQCVIITGESGAGKTEAAKLIMKYISAVSGNSPEIAYVKDVILQSNPLLEAFGNAKTLRNNNSSRFGKYFEIQFNRYGDPSGGKINHYLLEKSRIVYQKEGERAFHIFYQLLSGAHQQMIESLQLYQPEYFGYIANSRCFTIQGVDDAEDFKETVQAMYTIGIDEATQQNIFSLVASVLHLGNIQFAENGQGNSDIADDNALNVAAAILQVDPFTLRNALTFRVINTGGAGGRTSTYNVPQNKVQAEGARDALAKTIYSRIFDYLIEKTNQALSKFNLEFACVIGVLDIYGFEIFDFNSFEQFCINYVNEKLQQYFIELTLKAEQEEYKQEGIKWEPIKYFNNLVVCELIEGKAPPGMFSLLDDICYTMHAESSGNLDMKFLDKCIGTYTQNLHFRRADTSFTIKHYAGDVTYEIEGFCEKNKDTVYNDLIEAMQCSDNPFLVSLFPEDTKVKQSKRPTTAGFKIKTSCQSLIKTLSACTPHYVRCIKPNDTKQPQDWDDQRVSHQVKYLGLLENVRVRRAGFAYRAPFARFLNRYKKLSPKTWGIWGEWSGDPREGCTVVLQESGLDTKEWQLGKTKMFIRHPESLFFLEECLERYDYEKALVIQRAWRRWKAKKHALEQKAAAANIFRGKKERRRESVARQFTADYLNYDNNYTVQAAMDRYREERVAFDDQVIKFNRRCMPERRDLVITSSAYYLIMRAVKQGLALSKLTRRTTLQNISSVSLSTQQDNIVVIHSDSEFDVVLENSNKTELVAVLNEYYEMATGRKLAINFSDSITYRPKAGDSRQIVFQKDESASIPRIRKSGKTMTVMIQSGLDRNTDTAPQGFVPGAQRSAPVGRAAPGRAKGPAMGGPKGPGMGGPKGPGMGAPKGPGMGAAKGPGMGAPKGPSMGGPKGPGMGGPKGPGMGAAKGPGMGAPKGPGMGGPKGPGMAKAGGPGMAKGPKGPGPAKMPAAQPPKPQARALYPYNAQNDDELTFGEGEILVIIQKDANGWWEAEAGGQRGWVPANYVQEL
jgi:myosin-1